jgi:NusA-like protein
MTWKRRPEVMVSVDIAALRSIEREKEISFETVVDALETALLTAYRHTNHPMPHARVEIDRKTGAVTVSRSSTTLRPISAGSRR